MKNKTHKTYYICHHCMEYITFNKSDMRKHYNAFMKCNSKDVYTYEEAYELSMKHGFYLEMSKVDQLDYSSLIYEYSAEENEKKKREIKEYIKQTKIEEIKTKNPDSILYISELNKYKCKRCLSEFNNMERANQHLIKQNICDKKYKINHQIYNGSNTI